MPDQLNPSTCSARIATGHWRLLCGAYGLRRPDHHCDLTAGHPGDHRCACGELWPTRYPTAGGSR